MNGMPPSGWGGAHRGGNRGGTGKSPFAKEISSFGSDGEALAAAAGTLRIGIVEREAGGEIVLVPVHHRSDQVEHRGAVDVKGAAGGFDLFVERLLVGHIID